MHTILTLARQEITRLRTNFRGRARPIVALVLVAVLASAYLAFQQNVIRGRSLYRIGVAPDGPAIEDPRFNARTLEAGEGYAQVAAGTLDAYVEVRRVVHSDAERSLYAAGALKLYLESVELTRISEAHPAEAAFPLQIESSYFPVDLERPGQPFIPSLLNPPLPFAKVVAVSLYLFPVFLISVFFISGFMNEKAERRITVLLSAPVTPFQIIAGKMLPYLAFAMIAVVIITLAMGGDVLLALVIFAPMVLFIFSIYLMVPLIYRTFKDTTFISMFATTLITSYLVFPAMFTGINDLSYISPLTLAVDMYNNAPFNLRAYLTASLPMVLIFALAMYVGSRILNEEYLMGFRPLHRKLADALYLALNRERAGLSIALLSLALVPLVYIAQLVTLAIALNLPVRLAIGAMLVTVVTIEEIAKSAGIVTLIEKRDARKVWRIAALAMLSALGFLVGEKLLLYTSISTVSESALSAVLFNVGKLWIPLLAHAVFTTLVTLLTRWWGARRYPYAVAVGAGLHVVYNLAVLGVL